MQLYLAFESPHEMVERVRGGATTTIRAELVGIGYLEKINTDGKKGKRE